jgi:hypothetical protein
MRHCQDLLSRDRNAGAHWHSDAISVASPYYGRKYQHRSSEPVIRKYGLAPLMAAVYPCPYRVLVSGTIRFKSSD